VNSYNMHVHHITISYVVLNLRRNGHLNFDTRLQADAGDLLDNLAGGVQVDQSLMDFKLIAIPSLRTFTTRSLTGSNLQNLGGETDGAFNTELLVLGSVNEIGGELFQVSDITAGERDPDFVNFCTRHWSTGGVVFFFALSDVTHVAKL